jgi:hypothetical protein
MSETDAVATGLTTQYAAQVAGDLERNLKEQERISGEIAALQEQLAGLQQDHGVLVNVQQALGVASAPVEPSAGPAAAAVPAPRKKPAAKPARGAQAKKSAAPGRKPAAKKNTSEKTSDKAGSKAAQPTLVELVREHLAAQKEPRSAAEIATALGEQHPERAIKTTVVRNTLEGLVAKNHAQRTKQGSSVMYTAPDAPEPAAGSQESQKQSA